MIYFDNSATTLKKPPEVAQAVSYAINNFGNAHRSSSENAMLASREIYKTRIALAELISLDDPLQIAFTSSSTESLNLVVQGLISKGDSVITTVLEHNSVLRPLYLTGCDIEFLNCDDGGNLLVEELQLHLKKNTKYIVCTHGSNVLGMVSEIVAIKDFCIEHGLILVLDASQSMGAIEVRFDCADVICFTGHKALMGPQGTGGIIVNGEIPFKIAKTGGAGSDSFAHFQSADMPGIFEVGTMNSHGIYGLQKGIEYINKTGIDKIHAKEMELVNSFIDGVKSINGIIVYGEMEKLLPIVSINIADMTSQELSQVLWEKYSIATRSGIHCAPLLHNRFATNDRGMVRFSFSYFNTIDEIETCIKALKHIASER